MYVHKKSNLSCETPLIAGHIHGFLKISPHGPISWPSFWLLVFLSTLRTLFSLLICQIAHLMLIYLPSKIMVGSMLSPFPYAVARLRARRVLKHGLTNGLSCEINRRPTLQLMSAFLTPSRGEEVDRLVPVDTGSAKGLFQNDVSLYTVVDVGLRNADGSTLHNAEYEFLAESATVLLIIPRFQSSTPLTYIILRGMQPKVRMSLQEEKSADAQLYIEKRNLVSANQQIICSGEVATPHFCHAATE